MNFQLKKSLRKIRKFYEIPDFLKFSKRFASVGQRFENFPNVILPFRKIIHADDLEKVCKNFLVNNDLDYNVINNLLDGITEVLKQTISEPKA